MSPEKLSKLEKIRQKSKFERNKNPKGIQNLAYGGIVALATTIAMDFVPFSSVSTIDKINPSATETEIQIPEKINGIALEDFLKDFVKNPKPGAIVDIPLPDGRVETIEIKEERFNPYQTLNKIAIMMGIPEDAMYKRGKVIETGMVSFYGGSLDKTINKGAITRMGTAFNPHAFTAASNTLPLGSRIILERVETHDRKALLNQHAVVGKSAILEINDTGAFTGDDLAVPLNRMNSLGISPNVFLNNPFITNRRIIDVTEGVAKYFGIVETGLMLGRIVSLEEKTLAEKSQTISQVLFNPTYFQTNASQVFPKSSPENKAPSESNFQSSSEYSRDNPLLHPKYLDQGKSNSTAHPRSSSR